MSANTRPSELDEEEERLLQRLEQIRNEKRALEKAKSEEKTITAELSTIARDQQVPLNTVILEKQNGKSESASDRKQSTPTDKPSNHGINNFCRPPEDWMKFAFGTFTSEFELDERLNILNSMLFENKMPELAASSNLPISSLEEGVVVSLKGKLHGTAKPEFTASSGKKKAPKRRKVEIEVLPPEEMTQTATVTKVIIVESGIGGPMFKKIVAALDARKEEDEGQLVFVTGIIQRRSGTSPYICVNKKSLHVALIGLLPPKYPVVHDMDGNPILFPMPLDDKNISRLKGSFPGVWFCPLSESKLSKNQQDLLCHHISAYRSSGGGVIYLGLKTARCDKSEVRVENVAVELSPKMLEELKKQIEEACKMQSPLLCAREWEGRVLPDNIQQRLNECFNTYFTASNRCSFVIRMVICPSEHPLHLCKVGDIGLSIRHGETSSPYPIEKFVSKLSETFADVKKELEDLELAETSCLPTVESGFSLPLWQQMPPENGNLDNKELFDDPVKFAIAKLEIYGETWLNDPDKRGGTLHMGISNMPPLVTGAWLTKSTTQSLIKNLATRYKGSLEKENFCFPSAINHFTLKKHRIIANSDALLSKESKVLVLWLKVPGANDSCETRESVRYSFYCSWAQKRCPIFQQILDVGREHPPLLLPLKLNFVGLSPPIEGSFPFALSKPKSLHQDKLDAIITALLLELKEKKSQYSEHVASHQFIHCANALDILDDDYCTLEIVVSPGKKNLLYLCKLPEFWKLDAQSNTLEDFEHIGLCPKQMSFQDIVVKCGDNNLAITYFKAFFQFDDRPILITDVGNQDITEIRGLASVPWTLVVDFDFDSSIKSNSMREIAEKEAQHIFKVHDLPVSRGGCFNSEAMSDMGCIYWAKALGPSNELTVDPTAWRLNLATLINKYVTQACSAMAPKVRILVVWSAADNSSQFGQAISEICLAAQQSNPHKMAEIAVICPTLVSPFLKKLETCDLPRQPKIISMSLKDLSYCISQCCSAGTDGIDGWSSVPHKVSKLPAETVRSMQAGGLDYLYPNIEKYLNMAKYDGGLAFFEGRSAFVRWNDFKANVVVDRPETQSLYKRVKKTLRNRRDTEVVHFTHYPGAGGSTVARSVLWRLRKTFCCIVPSRIYPNLRQDIRKLIDTSEGRAVLVLWDSDLGFDFELLLSALKGLNAVILRVVRLANTKAQVDLKESLSYDVLEAFYVILSKNEHFCKSTDALDFLLLYAKRNKEEVPLFLVMVTALENKFLRLRDYVKERLINITDDQKSILQQIAFSRLYISKALQVNAVSAKDKNWENNLPSSVSSMISFIHLNSRRVRMRHHCIDELILSETTGIENTTQDWGFWLSDYVVKFIDHLRCIYPNIPECESSGNNEFERILRGMFHEKQHNAQISHFVSLIGSLAGKEAVVMCMRRVEEKLPSIKRIVAHFLGDLARVHLHINDMNLQAALLVMKEAHAQLPSNRTLYHQEGQLYFDAMTLLTQNTLLVTKEPERLAIEIIDLAQRASDCFMISRDCRMQGRTSELYPWISDLQCHIKCLTDVCSLMKCSFNNLPRSLATHEYLRNVNNNISFLLETLCTEDPVFYNESLTKVLELLGSEANVDAELKKLFDIIEEKPRDDSCYGTNGSLQKKVNALRHINYLLRLRYENARRVPECLCTNMTKAIVELIERPRVIRSALAQKGHIDRFFELELLWDWFRYAMLPISRVGMLSIIDKYLEKLTSPNLLRAKCLLFKGVTVLLQLLCDHNPDVNPKDVTNPISECNRIVSGLLQTENRSWRYSEFLTEQCGKGLLSSKDWFWKDSLPRAVNDNAELNRGYEKHQHTTFQEFYGQVNWISPDGRDGEVTCTGLSFTFVPTNAPEEWKKLNTGAVKFYASVSALKGLQAYPVYHLEDGHDKRSRHIWKLQKQCQQGRVVDIDKNKGLVYFGAPDLSQPYGAKASCRIDDFEVKPEIGDIYEFFVRRIRVDKSGSNFEAYDLRFVRGSQTEGR